MQSLSRYFFSDLRFRTQAAWFKRLLYIFLFVQSSYYLSYFGLFFGQESIVFVTPKSIGFFRGLAFLLYNSESVVLARIFLFGVLCSSAINLFLRSFRLPGDLLLWFLMLNLNNRVYPALTGGDNLLIQFLFFNCFLFPTTEVNGSARSELRAFFHNLASIALVVQVCLVYFLSALAKLEDESWRSGRAILQVAQIDHFSLFSFLRYTGRFDAVFIALNYLVLFYQLLFPLLIWIQKFKKPLLVLGILMHLYIAFVMGLMAFGFIMVLAYVFFWPSKQAVS